MATNNYISPETKVLDQNFYIPEGITNWIYEEKIEDNPLVDTTPPSEGDVDTTEDLTVGVADVELPEAITSPLQVPDTVTIVSQTIRMSPDGRQLVDVVIEILDVPEATVYDVRTTKV